MTQEILIPGGISVIELVDVPALLANGLTWVNAVELSGMLTIDVSDVFNRLYSPSFHSAVKGRLLEVTFSANDQLNDDPSILIGIGKTNWCSIRVPNSCMVIGY